VRCIVTEADLYPFVFAILLRKFNGAKIVFQPAGRGPRPDFVVELGGRRIAVEVKLYVGRRTCKQIETYEELYDEVCVAAPAKYAERFRGVCFIPLPVEPPPYRPRSGGTAKKEEEVRESAT